MHDPSTSSPLVLISDRQRPEPLLKPRVEALILAIIYVLACLAYIWMSSTLAAKFSESVGELAALEIIKGAGFILITGIAFYFFAYRHLDKIYRREKKLIEQQELILAAERKALAGIFAASTAHDINNLLSIMLGEIEDLHDDSFAQKPQGAETIERMEIVTTQLTTLARQLMDISRKGLPGGFEPHDLVVLVRDTSEYTKTHKRMKHCVVECDFPDRLEASVKAEILQQMLVNLMLNAADACPEEGKVRLVLQSQKNNMILEVHDNGPGIPAEQRDQVFDAFFTTKKEGTGLGLLSVKACVEMHQGTIEVHASPLGGACFRITIPLRQEVKG